MRGKRTGRIPGLIVLLIGLTAGPWVTPGTAQQTLAGIGLLEAIELYTGVSGQVNEQEASRLLKLEATDSSDVIATMWIARVHSTGRMTFPHKPALAKQIASGVIDEVRNLAASGDVEASFLMGTAYDESLGVTQDYGEAMRWYRRAADSGHILASHNIGNMYRDGRGVGQYPRRAAAWWLRAARAGDVIPALRLGEAYEAGRGVPQSHSIARYWYQRAAAAGNVSATVALTRINE